MKMRSEMVNKTEWEVTIDPEPTETMLGEVLDAIAEDLQDQIDEGGLASPCDMNREGSVTVSDLDGTDRTFDYDAEGHTEENDVDVYPVA